MGITGLYTVIGKGKHDVELSDFAGQVAAVDARGWSEQRSGLTRRLHQVIDGKDGIEKWLLMDWHSSQLCGSIYAHSRGSSEKWRDACVGV